MKGLLNCDLIGARIVNPETKTDKCTDLFIRDGKINYSHKSSEKCEQINLSGKIIIPSFVDLRLHQKDFAGNQSENLSLTTERAASGGFSVLLMMPNTNPVADNPAAVRLILERAQKVAKVKVLLAGTLTQNAEGRALSPMGSLMEAGISAVTDCPTSPSNNKIFINAVKYAKMFNLPIIEYPRTSDLSDGSMAHESLLSFKMGLQGEPRISEELAVHRAIAVSKSLDVSIHLSSISTYSSVDLIREAKKQHVRITADTTANHLILTEESIQSYDTNAKTQPYLCEESDRQALIDGLLDGTLDAITSGHDSWPNYLKKVEFDKAPSGAMGLETAFSATYKALSEKVKDPIALILEKLVTNPRRILGLSTDLLVENELANFNIVDLENKWEYNLDTMQCGDAQNSPLLNTSFDAKIITQLYKGKIVYSSIF
jgi:dihydroorotase